MKSLKVEIQISEFITKLSGCYDILFGLKQETINSHHDFMKLYRETSKTGNTLDYLNKHLLTNTFCNGYHVSISDLYAYADIAPHLHKLSDQEKWSYCNVVRWVDHIQNLKGIKQKAIELKLKISLPYEPLFLEKETPLVQNKKDKKDKVGGDKPKLEKPQSNLLSIINIIGKENDNQTDKIKIEETKIKEEKKEAKPEKQQQQKQKVADKKPAAKEEDIHPCSKLDIRVGKVVSIVVNDQSEKLYNEEIDIGNGEIRKIASGLKGKVPIEDLKDSYVVVLCNLKPRALCGWVSHGMILCATDSQGKTEPIRPPEGSKEGDLVSIGDFPRLPIAEINKKSPWDAVKDDIKINDDKLATYKNDSIWKTDLGAIHSKFVTNAPIS